MSTETPVPDTILDSVTLVAAFFAVLWVRTAGRLRRILPDWQAKPTPVYALTETRLLPQRFVEFLQERLGPASQDAHVMNSGSRSGAAG